MVAERSDDRLVASQASQKFEAAAHIPPPNIAGRHQHIETGRCWPERIRERQRFKVQIA